VEPDCHASGNCHWAAYLGLRSLMRYGLRSYRVSEPVHGRALQAAFIDQFVSADSGITDGGDTVKMSGASAALAPGVQAAGPTSSDAATTVSHVGAPVAAPKGYLAQHPLFDQIPALRADIAVPGMLAIEIEGDPMSVHCGHWIDVHVRLLQSR